LDFPIETKRYLLAQIKWLMPFYIQIILDEIEGTLSGRDTKKVTDEVVDHAIGSALKVRIYFENWYTRLRASFKGDEYSFALAFLNAISNEKEGLTSTGLFDIAAKYNVEAQYKSVLRILEYDGYVHEVTGEKWMFNSPLLGIWWHQNIAN